MIFYAYQLNGIFVIQITLTKEEIDSDTFFDKRTELSNCLYQNKKLRDAYEGKIMDILLSF